ncbi:MAG: outer membrane beta-barrel protein, partial [Spongiibacteraceae bacterium]
SQLQGSISASQSENLRSFADSIGLSQSVNTYRRLAADANYWLNSDWAVGVGAIKAASRYSDSASDDAEYDEDGFEAKVTYRTITGNQLSLVGAETHGSYPNQRVDAIDGDYRQRDIQLRGDWRLSGVSRIYGYVGVADREYEDLPARDFSGSVGKLEYDWQLTPKIDINFLVRREIGAEADLVDNFVVTKAASIKPTWSVTSRFSLSAEMEWLQRNYGGDPGLGVVSSIAKDDVTTIGTLAAGYVPFDNLQLSASWQTESRDSDAPSREYDDDIVMLSVRFTW